MFNIMFGMNLLSSIILAIFWGIAANRFGRLPFRSTIDQLRRSAGRLRIILIIANVLIIVKMAIIIYFSTFGWDFVDGQFMLVLPLILPSTIATLVLSFPLIWRIGGGKDLQKESHEMYKRMVFLPKVIVPVQITFVSTIFAAYFTAVQYPFTLSWLHAFYVWVLIGLIFTALWLRQQRHYQKFNELKSAFIYRVRRMIPLILIVILVSTGGFLYSAESSRVPEVYNMADHQQMTGKSIPTAHGAGHHQGHKQSVTDLKGPQQKKPDRRFTLVAKKQKIRLSSGKTMEAWTFNGQTPGPELRVRQGELVEVTLKNQDIKEGVTVHWHGYNVPNGEDGVAGVSQNAVKPGETYTYRYVAKQAGTYWYHSHQQSSIQVSKGLFGSLVVLPKKHSKQKVKDITVIDHVWKPSTDADAIPAFGTADTLSKQKIKPGTPVRIRLINTEDEPRYFLLSGTSFRVVSLDGNPINAPTEVVNQRLLLGGGNRYDIIFTMPKTPVKLTSQNNAGELKVERLLMSQGGVSSKLPNMKADAPILDLAKYGKPKKTPFNINSKFDREYKFVLNNRFGFYDGKFQSQIYTINGKVFPHTPMLHVKKGDLVKTTYVNKGPVDHPMHLHGHHMLVLSHNGKPVTGSPWWTDTLNVGPGETYEVAFVADNLGVWMDHCHNLTHAVVGMTMHLVYEGVTTPFKAGLQSPNQPE